MAEKAIQSAGFPKGLDTFHPTMSMPDGTAKRLTNVDVLDDGRIRRRSGSTLVDASPLHSLFGFARKGYAVSGNDLVVIDEDENISVVRAGIGPLPVSFTVINGQVYWSNGISHGVIDSAGGDRIWGIPLASPPVCTPTALGGLNEGGYQVAVSFLLASGEEGGFADSTLVYVTAGGGISISGLPAIAPHTDITRFRVYVSTANGAIQYRVGDFPLGTASVAVTSATNFGEQETTAGMYPFPACDKLFYFKGRVFGVQKNVLWYSLPLRYRLYDPTAGYILFDSDIRMAADVNDGLYVSDGNITWSLFGDDPAKFERVVALPYPAVIGNPVRDYKSNNVYWFSTRGWCVGGPERQVKNLMEERVLPGSIESAVTLYREYNGVGQVLALVNEDGVSTATALT